MVDATRILAIGRGRQRLDRIAEHSHRLAFGPEVERRARHSGELTRRDAAGIDRQITVGGHRQRMPVNRARRLPGEIPVGVMSHVHDRGSIAGRRHLDPEFAVGRERVGSFRRELPRIALVACGGHHLEVNRRPLLRCPRRRFPELLVEADQTAVEMVGLVVRRQRVGLAIEFEPSGSDSVGHAATGRAEVGMLGRVAIERVEAEDDVHRLAVLPGHVQARQDRTEVCDGRLPAPGHFERVEVRLATIGQTAERDHGRQGIQSSGHGLGNSQIRCGQRRCRWLGCRRGTRQDHDQNHRRQSYPRHGLNSTREEMAWINRVPPAWR